MKKIILIVIAVILNSLPVYAELSTIEDIIYEKSEIADIANSNRYIDQILPDFNFEKTVRELQHGEQVLAPNNIVYKFLSLFAVEVYNNIGIMLIIIVLSIIWGIIANIKSSFNSRAVSDVSFLAFFLIFLGLTFKGLSQCLELAENLLSDQVLFMQTSVPVYSALVISSGNTLSAAGMEGVFLFFIQLISSILEMGGLPIVFWIAVLNMINCISEKFSIKKLIEFLKQLIKWSLGLLMTFFVSALTLSGLTASSVDGIGIKTLKFAIGNFVPIVGSFLSESATTVIASTSVLKNAVGTAGVITIIGMCAVPLIKMISLIVLYKLTAGIIEPLSDKRITAVVNEAGGAVTLIFLIVLTVSVMFVLGITIVLSVNNKLVY